MIPPCSIANETGFKVEFVAEHLERSIAHGNDIDLLSFVKAYEELNKFIGLLGTIFQFVQKDVHDKTTTLSKLMADDPRAYLSVNSMLTHELADQKKPGSSALLALHRALEFIVDFMKALADASDDDSVSSICRTSYEKTLSRFHNWVVRKAVGLASYTLPCRRRLIEAIQGLKPEEDYVRNVIYSVVSSGDQVYARVQIMYDDYKLHDLI